MQRIRDASGLYRLVLILSIVAAVVYGAASIVSGSPQGLGIPSQYNFQAGNSTATTSPNGALLGYVALAGLIGLINFILIIISWLRWRDGVRQLVTAAPEYGPTHANEAKEARRDYGYTVWTFILFILTIIVVVGAATVVIASTVVGHIGLNRTAALTAAQASQLRSEVLALIVVAVIAGAVYQFIQYLFASRSLKASFFSLASPEQRNLLDRGRTLTLVGAALYFATALELVTPYGALIAILPPLLILLGFTNLLNAYDGWLAGRPTVASGPPPAPPISTPFR